MKKICLVPLFLSALTLGAFGQDFVAVDATSNDYAECFNIEEKSDGTYKIVSVKDEYTSSTYLRIYSNYVDSQIVINEISEGIFDSCSSLSTVMISNKISTIPQYFFENTPNLTVEFTGSIKEWNSYNFTTEVTVFDYACDEGFINFWNTYVRVNENSNICDISTETYQKLMTLYSRLSMDDYETVNEYVDVKGDSIKKSIEYLKDLFEPKEKPTQDELSKDTTLTLVVIIAIFGMSAIAIFYLLKMKGIIN